MYLLKKVWALQIHFNWYFLSPLSPMSGECLKLKNKEECDKPSSSSVIGVVKEKYEGLKLVLAFTISYGRFNDKWVLDTTYTFHISPKKDLFTTYELVNGGSVFIGNNFACKIVGVDTIRIRMHKGIARTLMNVRHIPDLEKNIISLGTLDFLRYKYSSVSGVIKVSKGSLVDMYFYRAVR
jgi:hypothetical protein